MGSLMSGWDSPNKDPEVVKLMRNKSLTKEGIEEYWKSKKKSEEEHLKFATSPATSDYEVNFSDEEIMKEYKSSSSLPIINTKNGYLLLGKESDQINIADIMKKNGWWTSSNWAFLNEPPVITAEVPQYKYASQHHVATMATRIPSA